MIPRSIPHFSDRRRSSVQILTAAPLTAVRSLSSAGSYGLRRLSTVFFTNPATKSTTSRSSDLDVNDVRQKVLAKIDAEAKSEQQLFDVRDIVRIKSDDWFVERFIEDKANDDNRSSTGELMNDVINSMLDCLKWQAENQINDLSSANFPLEFFDSGLLSIGADFNGTPLLFIRAKLHKKIAEWSSINKSFTNYVYELLDRKVIGSRAAGLGVIVDLSGAGLSNFDFEQNVHVLELFTKYYPKSCAFFYIHGCPWILKPPVKLMLKLIPSKYYNLVKLTDPKSICELLGGPQFVPIFMGGQMATGLMKPKASPSLEEIAQKYNISESALASLRTHFASNKEKE